MDAMIPPATSNSPGNTKGARIYFFINSSSFDHRRPEPGYLQYAICAYRHQDDRYDEEQAGEQKLFSKDPVACLGVRYTGKDEGTGCGKR